MSLKSLKLFRR